MRGDFTVLELVQACLKRIEEKNKELNAYLEVYANVLEQAKAADLKLKNLRAAQRAQLSNLFGVPIALKDNILVKGERASASSRILEGYIAPYDATVVRKLKEAGAILLGRTNMDEFAMGSSTETSAFGSTKNPYDTSRVPGGSSGGAAAAVVAGMALGALGTDTAGSVRQPASFCGLVGVKNTYGSISRSGLIAMGNSLDIAGPIAKTVEDAEILFDCVKGRDPLDSTSVELPRLPIGGQATTHDSACQSAGRQQPTTKLKVGVPRNFLEMKGIDADVLENFNQSIERLKALGCTITDISLPTVPHSLAVYYVVMPAELSTNLSRFDGVKYGLYREGESLLGDYLQTRTGGFGKEARRRLLLGAFVLSSGYYDAYYRKAINVRIQIEREFAAAFEEVDVIATPTTPTPAFKLGEKMTDPLSMYVADIFTIVANMGAIPAISIPSGYAHREGKRLPLGLQLMAAYGNDRRLFMLGTLFESAQQ
jgi:aspartyl-tRNA(Asn)/glutamyl-tRNA(Gln) amidotransferase subunit A